MNNFPSTRPPLSIQKGSQLHFDCLNCKEPVTFSVLTFKEEGPRIGCEDCGQVYSFGEETILRQIYQFEALCRQIHESEEILGRTAVGVDVGPHSVKVPYKLLLTRLTSELQLQMGEQEFIIKFRIEPVQDVPHAESIACP